MLLRIVYELYRKYFYSVYVQRVVALAIGFTRLFWMLVFSISLKPCYHSCHSCCWQASQIESKFLKQLNYSPLLLQDNLMNKQDFNCYKLKFCFPTKNRNIDAKNVRSTTVKQNYILSCQNLYDAIQNHWLKWLWSTRKFACYLPHQRLSTFLFTSNCNPILQFPFLFFFLSVLFHSIFNYLFQVCIYFIFHLWVCNANYMFH